MILFSSSGRLGNQLFQYAGLKKYFPNHSFIFFGCEELLECFDNVDVRFIRKDTIIRRVFSLLLNRIIFFLSNVGILGRITEDSNSNRFSLIVQKGLSPGIFVPQNIYFQHFDVLDHIDNPPVLKPYLLEQAMCWLQKKEINSNNDSPVFVHIRRGDYLTWPSREFPAVLDLSWYKRAMDSIQEKISNPVFIFMGDDQNYLRNVFVESESLAISDNSPEIDLALMSLCSSGILSASSFAWWGALYSRTTKKNNAYFIAPKYWAGHRSKKWYPANFRTEWINYIE